MRVVLAALALAACAPTAPPSSAPAPDPLAVRYEVRVGQTALPNVRSVAVAGPNFEIIEARPAGAPASLLPGRVGAIRLVIRTDWAAGETTMETWRSGITSPDPDRPLSFTRQDVTVVVTSPGGAAPASYAYRRCLPSEHEMQLAGQDQRIEQVWRIICEGVVRS
jgi:hypothetical protein